MVLADRVITHVNLRIAASQVQTMTELRNRDVAMQDGLDLELIGYGISRVILGVPRDVEPGRVGSGGSDGNRLIIRELEGRVEAVGLEVRRRDVEEVGLELDLAVLLSPDLALLGDLRTVVVGGEAFGVAEVAPVRSSVGLTVC